MYITYKYKYIFTKVYKYIFTRIHSEAQNVPAYSFTNFAPLLVAK